MTIIAGVDEVGRGPLAGPVVAAAVALPEGYANPKIKDSKQLSAKTREYLSEEIKQVALQWSIVSVGPRRIESLNIREASRLAMKLAVERLNVDLILVDGDTPIDTPILQKTVIGGDRIHIQISAASIIAKVYRDQLMKQLDQRYPGYLLGTHAGYPTKSHKEAIHKLGPTKIHRRTFSGVKEYLRLFKTDTKEDSRSISS